MHNSDSLKDWSDIQIFLAIARQGTLGRAGAVLGLTQPSVGRRLSALEERTGAHLFIRSGRRMRLTDAGAAILPAAERVEREMLSIAGALDMQTKGLAGEVVISAAEGLGTEWLTPELRRFRELHPDITVFMRIENRKADLLHREADIALRMGRPTEPDLIARKLTSLHFGLYVNRRLLETVGQVDEPRDLLGLPYVDFDYAPQAAATANLLSDLIKTNTDIPKPVFVTNSPAAQAAAVKAGIGFGVMSRRWAALYKELVPLLPDVKVDPIELWLVTHEDLRHSARIRALADFIADRVKANRSLFEGSLSPEQS